MLGKARSLGCIEFRVSTVELVSTLRDYLEVACHVGLGKEGQSE